MMNSKSDALSQNSKSTSKDPAMAGLQHLKSQLDKLEGGKEGEADGYVAMVVGDDTKGTMSQAILAQHMKTRAPIMDLNNIPDDYTQIKNPNGMPLTEKQQIIIKLRGQNAKLKKELRVLSTTLENFMNNQKQQKIDKLKNSVMGGHGTDPINIPTRVL